MMKYPIKKEFFPFNLLTPPISSPEMAGKMGERMKPPKWLWRDKEISVRKKVIGGYQGIITATQSPIFCMCPARLYSCSIA